MDENNNKNTAEQEKAAEQEQTPKTYRERFFEGIRGKYKDTELDDEGVYQKAIEGYDADHERLKKVEADNSSIIDRLKENPEVAVFVSDLIAGKIPPEVVEYIIENYPYIDQVDGYEDFKNDRMSRKELFAEIDKKTEEILENSKESEKNIAAYAKEEGVSEEEIENDIKAANEMIIAPLQQGKFTVETLEKIRNLVHLDEVMKEAENRGYIKGREEAFEAKRAGKAGDGLPNPASKAPTGKKKEIENPYPKRDVWENGGFTR